MLLQSYRLSSLIAHSVILKNRWQIKCELMDIRQLKENEGLHYIGLSFGGVNGWTVSFEYKNYRFYRIKFVKDDTSKYPILTDISRKIAAKYPQYVIEDFVDYYPDDFFVSMEVVKYLMVKLPVICMPIESAYQTTHGNICQISYMINQEMEDSQVLMNCKL